MALMLCPLRGSRRNQTEPVVNRISEVLLDLLADALSAVAAGPAIVTHASPTSNTQGSPLGVKIVVCRLPLVTLTRKFCRAWSLI